MLLRECVERATVLRKSGEWRVEVVEWCASFYTADNEVHAGSKEGTSSTS